MNISLKSFLKEKEEELVKLSAIVATLRTARVPIVVDVRENDFYLFSDDYLLAEDFKIRKRSKYLGGFSGPEGGYSTHRYETYPQFYFCLRHGGVVIPVDVKHKGFDEDSRVVIGSVTKTEGSKDYASENRTLDGCVDLKQVFKFFSDRGVSRNLLDKLGRRIKAAEEF